MLTTIASWGLLLAKGLEAKGVDARTIFEQADIDFAVLDDPEARVPYEKLVVAWQLCVEKTADPCFGLHCAKFWHPTTLHGLGFAWLASSTLKEALERVVRYGRLMHDALAPKLTEQADSYRFVLARAPIGSRPADAAMDCGLAVTLQMCRSSCGGEFAPICAEISHARPECHEDFEAFFGCPVEFDAEELALIFERRCLEQPLPTGNKTLAYANEKVIEDYLRRLDRDSIDTQVRTTIIDRLPSGYISEDVVAEALHMSKRTLQRKLAECGTSFQQLLDDTRRQLATEYIQRSARSINEVTYLLGFSEPSNFTRAFRRWHGVAPSAYREAHSAAQ